MNCRLTARLTPRVVVSDPTTDLRETPAREGSISVPLPGNSFYKDATPEFLHSELVRLYADLGPDKVVYDWLVVA